MFVLVWGQIMVPCVCWFGIKSLYLVCVCVLSKCGLVCVGMLVNRCIKCALVCCQIVVPCVCWYVVKAWSRVCVGILSKRGIMCVLVCVAMVSEGAGDHAVCVCVCVCVCARQHRGQQQRERGC